MPLAGSVPGHVLKVGGTRLQPRMVINFAGTVVDDPTNHETDVTLGGGSGSGDVIASGTLTSTKILKGGGTTVAIASKVGITEPTTAGTLVFGTDNATLTFPGTSSIIGTAGLTNGRILIAGASLAAVADDAKYIVATGVNPSITGTAATTVQTLNVNGYFRGTLTETAGGTGGDADIAWPLYSWTFTANPSSAAWGTRTAFKVQVGITAGNTFASSATNGGILGIDSTAHNGNIATTGITFAALPYGVLSVGGTTGYAFNDGNGSGSFGSVVVLFGLWGESTSRGGHVYNQWGSHFGTGVYGGVIDNEVSAIHIGYDNAGTLAGQYIDVTATVALRTDIHMLNAVGTATADWSILDENTKPSKFSGPIQLVQSHTTAFIVGRTSADPAFRVKTDIANGVTGWLVTPTAAGGTGVTMAAAGGNTNEAATIIARGTGALTLASVVAGGTVVLATNTVPRLTVSDTDIAVASTVTITSVSASALAIGRQGATAPVLQVDASVASVTSGLSIAGGTTATTLTAIGSGADISLILAGKGIGTFTFASGSTSGAGGFIFFNANAVANAFAVDGLRNIVCGSAALATTATDGHFYMPTCAGTPTGVVTTKTGRSPVIYDSTNKKLWVNDAGTWRKGQVTAVDVIFA